MQDVCCTTVYSVTSHSLAASYHSMSGNSEQRAAFTIHTNGHTAFASPIPIMIQTVPEPVLGFLSKHHSPFVECILERK